MTPALHLSRLSVALLLPFLFWIPIASYAQDDDPFQRGLAALKENRMEDALAELTSAERERPADPLARNFRGIVLARLGRNGEAGAEYEEATRLNPLFEDAYRNLGFLKWTEKQFEAAREALERAVQLSPADSFAHYYLGRVELDEQHYAAAIKDLETSGVPLPADADFSIQLARAYIAISRREDAHKLLAFLSSTSLSGAQSVHLAELFLALRENDEAVATIQRIETKASSGNDSWRKFDAALAYLLSGDFGKAVSQADTYNNSLPHDNSKLLESAAAWTIVGIAAAHLKQNERSLNAFQHAAALRPGEEEYWLNLTRELMELSRYSDAITAVRRGLDANPKSYALHLRLGAAQLAAGHYAEAENVFRDLVAKGDPLPNSYVGLAQVLLRTGRAEEASSEIVAAEKKLGPNFLFSYFRGLALERAGKPQEALSAFQEAVELNPGNAEAHLSVGKTQLNLGHVQLAVAELEEAQRLSPENEQARRLLSKAYSRTGDANRASSAAEASTSATREAADEFIDDFFVPQWQMPPENAKPSMP
jgi:tetratricopeptide (TPR) repeat protein